MVRRAQDATPAVLEDDYPEQAQASATMPGSEAASLAALGQALMNAASEGATAEDQVAAMATLREVLPRLNFKKFPQLRDDPVIEAFLDQLSEERANSADVPPGTVIDRGKPTERIKDWTERDLIQSGQQLVTFTPNETMPIIWNGLRCQLIADQEITTYKCFYDVYMEHKFETRFAEAHKSWLFGQRDDLPHPDMANPDGVRARASATGGTLINGGGLFDAEAAAAAGTEQEAAGGQAS